MNINREKEARLKKILGLKKAPMVARGVSGNYLDREGVLGTNIDPFLHSTKYQLAGVAAAYFTWLVDALFLVFFRLSVLRSVRIKRRR